MQFDCLTPSPGLLAAGCGSAGRSPRADWKRAATSPRTAPGDSTRNLQSGGKKLLKKKH